MSSIINMYINMKRNYLVCTPPTSSSGKKIFIVNNVQSLREIRKEGSHCTSINGSLEINIKGGSKYTKS